MLGGELQIKSQRGGLAGWLAGKKNVNLFIHGQHQGAQRTHTKVVVLILKFDPVLVFIYEFQERNHKSLW